MNRPVTDQGIQRMTDARPECMTTRVKITLLRFLICWMGNHQVAIHLYRHLRIYDMSSQMLLYNRHTFTALIHEISLTIASRTASLLEQRDSSMVPNIPGERLQGGVEVTLFSIRSSKEALPF